MEATNTGRVEEILLPKCILCNLSQDTVSYPSRLNRFGPIPTNLCKAKDSEESNGSIFRPYLTSGEADSAPKRSPHETIDYKNGTNCLNIGHREKQTLSDLADKYGIFWAHEACLFWSRTRSKTAESSYLDVMEEYLSQVSF